MEPYTATKNKGQHITKQPPAETADMMLLAMAKLPTQTSPPSSSSFHCHVRHHIQV
jgi:hypothetical protein